MPPVDGIPTMNGEVFADAEEEEGEEEEDEGEAEFEEEEQVKQVGNPSYQRSIQVTTFRNLI